MKVKINYIEHAAIYSINSSIYWIETTVLPICRFPAGNMQKFSISLKLLALNVRTTYKKIFENLEFSSFTET